LEFKQKGNVSAAQYDWDQIAAADEAALMA
jgi:hypothetical protein